MVIPCVLIACLDEQKESADLVKMLNEASWDASTVSAWKNGERKARVLLTRVLLLIDVVVAPSALHVAAVARDVKGDVQLAGQNCYHETKGAFTGESSPDALVDAGAKWVVLGHSERRNVFGESSEV